MRDMTPPGERSIRNIPVSHHAHRRSAPQERFSGDIPLPKRRRSKKWLWWTLAAIAVCVVAGLLLSTLFEGATITVTPKEQQVTPPQNITALPNAPAGSLAYQTVTFSQSATTTANATGTTHVSKQASGLITIYNSYSTASQQLVANTRFQAEDGKVYRIHAGVTVPGEKKAADGSMTPGELTVTVYADQPGADYNRSESTTFTIPGFKGDPRYAKFSAKSQGAISGGFVGEQPTVSSGDMEKAQAVLKQALDSALAQQAQAQTPDGFLPVQNSLSVTYSDIATAQQGSGSTVSLSQSASATMAMVSDNDLAAILAKLLVQGYGGESVRFKDPNPLVLELGSTTQKTTGPLTILLQGTPTLVWQFDQNALIQGLLGKKKSDFEGIIETFSPAIQKAQASIRPFWEANFPTEESKLHIKIED